MLFHVIPRPAHQRTEVKHRPVAAPKPRSTLMPRYHYSRLVSTPNNSETTSLPLRASTGHQREFIPIPITRENGTTITTLPPTSRSVPFTYITEEPSTNTSFISKCVVDSRWLKDLIGFEGLLRPSSRYFQHQLSNNGDENGLLGSARRSSLTLPVLNTAGKTNHFDEMESVRSPPPFSTVRQIPIRYPSNPSSSRTSSATVRPIVPTNLLQRQKTDLGGLSSSSTPLLNITIPTLSSSSGSDFTVSSPIRRAEVMAREAIQNLARLQHEQRNQTSLSNGRSPSASRRVIINLQNNQSASLDGRLKAPFVPSSREKNNLHVIPVLQEIQPDEAPMTTSANSHASSTNYKNEFHIEIPVTFTTNIEEENHPPLKSILKRSSSRDAMTRKNVSFRNA